MKKLLFLIMIVSLILCGCAEEVEEPAIEIPFQKVAAYNNRTKLLEKYSYISERTASKYAGDSEFSYWVLYYEKNGENINAILDYSEDYKCYYYNNQIYANYGDGFMRTVIPYREKYSDIISSLLARTDTLSYVFITNSTAEKTDEGYKTCYDFIVNKDILPEFEDLGVKAGEKISIEYDLDENFIIQRCRYYRPKDTYRVQIARIDVEYGNKIEFPKEVTEYNSAEKVKIKITEDFGTGAEYFETFEIAKDSYISENEELLKYYLYKDPVYDDYFDSVTEVVDNDIEIFIIDSYFAEKLEAKKAEMLAQELGIDVTKLDAEEIEEMIKKAQ